MIVDNLGLPLNEGDEVLYAMGGNRDDGLYRGIITNTNPKGYQQFNSKFVEIKATKSGRIIYRKTINVVSIEPMREQNPELFI